MKETRYQQEEIKAARRLQEDCVNLHMPSPPLLTYEIEIVNSDGSIAERIHSKANSYVRNALNLMAWNVGGASYGLNNTTYGNGTLGIKDTIGDTYTPESGNRKNYENVQLDLGYLDTDENINDYRIQSSVSFNAADTSVFSYYSNNIFYTEITRSFALPSIYDQTTVSAAAIYQRFAGSNGRVIMIVRDKFPEVKILKGQSMNLKYLIEILYPT